MAARDKCDAISLPDQTHLTAVVCRFHGAGNVEVVAVAAAGDAVAAGWSSASSSSLMDASWVGCRYHCLSEALVVVSVTQTQALIRHVLHRPLLCRTHHC